MAPWACANLAISNADEAAAAPLINVLREVGNGSKIIFRGIKTSSGDQTANLKSLTGITTWVMDEAEELNDEDIFDKIDLSVRNKIQENRVILILNPTTKEHFIYKRWFEYRGVSAGSNITKEDTTYIHTTYLDNLDNLSESYIESASTARPRGGHGVACIFKRRIGQCQK